LENASSLALLCASASARQQVLAAAAGQLREIPHYSSILSFHHSAPNKPNLGGLVQFRSLCGHSHGRDGWRRQKVAQGGLFPWHRRERRCCMGETPMPRNTWRRLPACAGMTLLRTRLSRQTNPIWERVEGRTSAVWITSCDEWDTGDAVEEQTQFPGHGRDARGTHGRDAHATECLAAPPRTRLPRQTNPISRQGQAGRGLCARGRGLLYKQSQFPAMASGMRHERAKRTQSRQPGRGLRDEGRLCKTKPNLEGCDIWGDGTTRRGQMRKRNPISRSWPSGYPTIPVFHHSTVPVSAHCAKQTQFRDDLNEG
jgi:hypothetical protein